LLLENNRAIASYAKALELRNGKCFRRVTEEGYRNFQVNRPQWLNQAKVSSSVI